MLFDSFNELDRISSAFFSGLPEPALSAAPVNLYRDDDRYVVEVDLPGFDPSSIDVSAEAGLLTIRADRDTAHEDRGEPSFTDAYARVGYQLNESLALTASALRFDDDLELNDTDFEETAVAVYRDAYYWLRLDYEPGPDLHGRLLIARTDLDSDRTGSVDQPGIASGELTDHRRFAVDSLQTDWSMARSDSLAFAFGVEWRRMDGSYDYTDQADFDVLFLTPGAPTEPTRDRSLSASPSGEQFAVYASVRAELYAGLVADLGLRWDRETLSDAGDDGLSPRASVLWPLGERTHVRAAWGRYLQAQAINELQVSDGVTVFLPPQRADQ